MAGYSPWGHKESDMTEQLSMHALLKLNQLLKIYFILGFPGDSVVKNQPADAGDQEVWVQFLGQEDPLEEEMATCSSILAWKIPWTEDSGRLQSMGPQRVRHD